MISWNYLLYVFPLPLPASLLSVPQSVRTQNGAWPSAVLFYLLHKTYLSAGNPANLPRGGRAGLAGARKRHERRLDGPPPQPRRGTMELLT